MTLTTVNQQILGRFKTLIETGGDGGSAVFTLYPNVPTRDEPTTDPWALVTLREGSREQITLAPSVVSRTDACRLYVDLYGSAGKGTKALTDLAQRVLAAFQRVTLTTGTTDIVFETPGYGAGGSGGERQGDEWRVQLVCPYRVDDRD